MKGDKFRPGPRAREAPPAVLDPRLLAALRGFYFRGFFLFFLLLEILIDIVLRPSRTLTLSSLVGLILLALVDAHFLARFHYRDAVRNGPGFLVKRLQARPPILRQPHHARFEDTLERMRDNAGLPWVKPYTSPHSSIDAVAFVETDGTPALAVTEALPRTYALLCFAPEAPLPTNRGRIAEWPGSRPSILERLRALAPLTGEEPAIVLRRAREAAAEEAAPG